MNCVESTIQRLDYRGLSQASDALYVARDGATYDGVSIDRGVAQYPAIMNAIMGEHAVMGLGRKSVVFNAVGQQYPRGFTAQAQSTSQFNKGRSITLHR